MTTFQTNVLAALAPFAAFSADSVDYVAGRAWVWLHTTEADYRKARSALRRFTLRPYDRRSFFVLSPEGNSEVWVFLTSAPKRG